MSTDYRDQWAALTDGDGLPTTGPNSQAQCMTQGHPDVGVPDHPPQFEGRSYTSAEIDAVQRDAYAEGRKDEADENGAASRLIDAWVAAHGKPVPWKLAVEIVAVVNRLPEAERAKLLALDA